jgi:putative MATE family efflux protein
VSLGETIRRALKGGEHDYTEGPLGAAIILLAVPMVLEMVMESVFAVADVFWVSRLGAESVAIVGLTESLMVITYAVAMGLSIAATAVVARRTGEKDPDAAARAAVQVITLAVTVGVMLGVIGVALGPTLLGTLGADPDLVRHGTPFVRVMLGSNLVVLLLYLLNAIFRGVGDATIAMRTLWFANFLNIVLGPCFIFGLGPLPRLGVTGAAVATAIGRGSGVLFQLYVLLRGQGRIAIARRHVAIELKTVASLLRVSSTGIVQMLIAMTSWIGLVRILSSFGKTALAGYTIAIRIVIFALLPCAGIANAAATLVGQNLGAKRPERAEASVRLAARSGVMFLGVVGALVVALAAPGMRLFSDDPDVLAYGTRALRIIGLGFPFYAYEMTIMQAFNGAGDTWTPTLINLGAFWIFEIPLAWTLAVPLGAGPTGVFTAITLAFSGSAVVATLLFRRGQWKRTAV